jgi:hypothetical protein
MNPKEYLQIERDQNRVIDNAKAMIYHAAIEAHRCAPPLYHRPAVSADIVEGTIIWHTREAKHGGDYWNVVFDVLNPISECKAYVADDGCRYGLSGAYVELPPPAGFEAGDQVRRNKHSKKA